MRMISQPLRRLALAAALAMLAGPVLAATLEVGPGKEFAMPSAALAKAQDGDTILVSPGEYFDCAIIRQNNITIQGTNPDGSAIITDKACAGKGLLITAGNDITLRNLTLTRARVPDMNGAGIRAEGTNLTVERVKFINNQNGILTAPNPDSSLIVRDSEFTRNGVCAPSCAHGIYTGAIKLLRVENSRFWEQKEAHHIKSRALRTEIIGSDIRDGATGTSSYLIETPNGGTLIVRNTTMQKGPRSENRTCAIMIGAEGVTQPTREILIENNTFTNDGSYDTVLVENRTATEAMLKGNKLNGRAKPLRGDGEVR